MITGTIINELDARVGSTIIAQEDFLEDFDISFALLEVPSVNLLLPVKYSKYITGHTHIKLVSDDWVYEGYVVKKDIDFERGTINVDTSHIVGILSKGTLPTNVTVKGRSVVSTVEQAYNHWQGNTVLKADSMLKSFNINFLDSYASDYLVEYEFSNETYLEFLTKLCEKTPALYWRINRFEPYEIQFGLLGETKDVLINEHNNLISLSNITEDYEDVINIATVMSDKADAGASSLTLRDIYNDPELQLPDFPVIKTGNEVNSQRYFDYKQLPVFAPEIIGEEFAIVDTEGIALEAGQLFWGTVTDNETQAIAEDNKEITDEDRIEATKQLYLSAIRKMRNSRRKITYELVVEPLKKRTVQVGDKVMFSLNYGLWELTACSRYYEKVLKQNDWFYVTKITDKYGVGNAHVQELELSKYLYSDRDVKVGY